MTDVLVVSTVGTSILTNAADDDELREFIKRNANVRTFVGDEDRASLEAIKTQVQAELGKVDPTDQHQVGRLSAELKVLSLWRRTEPARRHRHLLLATDTALGQLAAACVRDALETLLGIKAEVEQIGGLQVASSNGLREALPGLMKAIDDRRDEQTAVVFNLAGSFKSVSGFLQQAAALWSAEVLYSFETADELVRIPTLPLDMALGDVALQSLRRAEILPEGIPTSEVEGLAGASVLFTEADEGRMLPSDWGRLLWVRQATQIYRARLLDPPTDRVVFGGQFPDEVARRAAGQPELFVRVNERIDDLSAWLEGGRQALPKRSTVKKLSGSFAPATHEAYATSDGPAYRILFRDEGQKIVLLELREHL
ncbi:putative CRISPR-associated protein [Aciditerrimonas ferrireducens]|uniref:putative CRISPR-associated protein n=1 Tax=Aciditerrimonas ferrireducens TaxID=667306 RepID=UPI002005CA9D|nr:putative CRISPR-associated protein [Aciditerrimonas ferrireducens]MCK4176168.1 putative CRISPR-associated protein [Aciditerrimonas ferrireducens]